MQLDPSLLAGPIGALIVLTFVVFQFSTGKWVARERLDEKEKDRKEMSAMLDKALDSAESTARAAAEKNRLEAIRLEGRQAGFSDGVADAERRLVGKRAIPSDSI